MELVYCPEDSRVLVPRSVILPVWEVIPKPSPAKMSPSLSLIGAVKPAVPVTVIFPETDDMVVWLLAELLIISTALLQLLPFVV